MAVFVLQQTANPRKQIESKELAVAIDFVLRAFGRPA